MKASSSVSSPVLLWFLSALLLFLTTTSYAAAIVVDPPVCSEGNGTSSRALQSTTTQQTTTFTNPYGSMDGSELCDPPCGPLQFCGKNRVCYENSCESYYLYGNTNYTGLTTTTTTASSSISTNGTTTPNIPALRCELLSSYADDTPVSVLYGCADIECASRERNVFKYNQVCAATPQDRVEFICYELTTTDGGGGDAVAQQLDGDLDLYVINTADSSGSMCDTTTTGNSMPLYLYSTRIHRDVDDASSLSITIRGRSVGTVAFNKTLALSTMTTFLRTADPTPAPVTSAPMTSAPVRAPPPTSTTPPPQAPLTSAATVAKHVATGFITGFVAFMGLLMIA
jgi:hypothetical protein